jgi:hypothetical protein
MKIANLIPIFVMSGLASSSYAGLIFTIEAPGVQSSTVAGVITEDFNAFPVGSLSNPTATVVGSLTGGGVEDANQFGGANSTKFYRPGSTPIDLTLPAAENYFGLWWSAGDSDNHLEFFDGATSLGAYNVGDIISVVNAAYYGNPNPPPGRNTAEPYAYLNFTTTDGSHITKVKLTGGNFELDNISITPEAITPPGTLPNGDPVPGVPDSGATLALLSTAAASLGFLKRHVRR